MRGVSNNNTGGGSGGMKVGVLSPWLVGWLARLSLTVCACACARVYTTCICMLYKQQEG